MAKTAYRKFQHWETWLTQHLGKSLLTAEQKLLGKWIAKFRGKHSLLLGVPEQYNLLQPQLTSYQHHWLLTPLFSHRKEIKSIEGEFSDIPISAGSLDLVLVPHVLEYVDNPRQVLSEACRLVKPEGHIILLGFNPYSFYGLKKFWMKSKNVPWSGQFIPMHKVKHWLTLSDFKLIKQHMLLYRPPISHPGLYKKLKFIELLGNLLFRPFGGVYVLVAQAKVTPLTPIRMHWKQELSDIPISTSTVAGPTTMRNPP